jgi:hypothetical protein
VLGRNGGGETEGAAASCGWLPSSGSFWAGDPVRAQSPAMSGSSAAGEDIVQHLSSNSNPSSSKLAKLEARMAGKAVSAPSSPPHHPVVASGSVIAFMDQEELPESSSDDDVSPKPSSPPLTFPF